MKPRRHVRLFKERFAEAVASGAKLQTIRPVPVRMPERGDIISLRCWTVLPYRSKQRVLGEGKIVGVQAVHLSQRSVIIYQDARPVRYRVHEALSAHGTRIGDFARADGFADWPEMRGWFEEAHGLPFNGILIGWKLLSGSNEK